MSPKFPRLLAGFEVYADWYERVKESEHYGFVAFSTAVVATLLAVLWLGIGWFRPEMDGFAVEATWFFLFGVGAWALTRSPLNCLTKYLLTVAAAILLMGGLLTIPLGQTNQGGGWAMVVRLMVSLGLWAVIGRWVWQDCSASPYCLLSLRWRSKALLYGSAVGVLLYVQIFLARVLADIDQAAEMPVSLQMIGWAATTILVGAVAEELIFRATIFDYLHKVNGMNLWVAVAMSMALNLLIYVPLASLRAAPEDQILFWLGPMMISLTNALLWTWERGINSVIASNFLFRLLTLFLP